MGIDASISVGGRSTSKYDFPEKVPKKLSDLENDLFYTKRIPFVTLTKDDFVFNEELDGYLYTSSPKIDWCSSVDDVDFSLKAIVGGETFVVTKADVGEDNCWISQESDDSGSVVGFYLELGIFWVLSGVDAIAEEIIPVNSYTIGIYPDRFDSIEDFTFELFRIDSKKVPIEFCDTSEIEAEIDTLIDEVNAL